ncbi:MAG TPA: hypothetical protein VK654_08855 [Nitrospirota bacterium]|nr:hypothetical protein [Nitrospirota bacterium]
MPESTGKRTARTVIIAFALLPLVDILFSMESMTWGCCFGSAHSAFAETVETAPTATSAPLSQPVSSSPPSQQKVPQTPGEEQPQPAPGAQPATKKIAGFMDILHGELSRRLVDTAEWMDSFFADENYIKEKNQSYAVYRNDFFKEERANITYKPAFSMRLAMPEFERKTHLILSAEPRNTETANAPAQTAGERFGTTDQRSLTTAVHYIFRSTAQENFFVRTGLQFSQFSPVVLLEPRYRVLFPLDPWNLRFTQDVLWKSNTSWQTDTRFELERLLPRDYFFRTSLDGIWSAKVDGYIYSLAFSIRQPLTPTRALDYAWINTYWTRPTGKFMDTSFVVRYRHSIWRNWLFYEFAPQVRFSRPQNFRSIPGILFRLEMFFGQ